MKIYHISDTHGYHDQIDLKPADVIVFSGDAGNYRDPYRSEKEVRDFIDWFKSLDYEHKIMIAGNHDSSIEEGLLSAKKGEFGDIHYLEDDSTIIDGVKFWGSPFTHNFHNWSFQATEKVLWRVWDMIDNDTDVLVTHGPPKGVLDLVGDINAGSSTLRDKVLDLQPKLHLFGHIHTGVNYGTKSLHNSTTFSNASCVEDGKFQSGPYKNGILLEI